MSKHDDERERQRSARKKAEIDAEVNNNREIVYNYVASRKDVLGKQCVEELQFFEKGKRYLEWLSLNGYLVRMKRTVDNKRQYVYNAVKPYVKPVCEEFEVIDKADAEAQIAVKNVTRVFKLLDREHVPMTKEDRERLRRSTKSVSIGSSMNMFGSW
jgi:hypothetical protein